MRHTIGLALLAVLSAACDSGGTAVLKLRGSVAGTAIASAAPTQVATLGGDPSAPAVFKMKLIAAYLSEQVAAGGGDNVGRTPMIYLNPDCRGDIVHCDLSPGTAPDGNPVTHLVERYFDFGLPPDQVNAALNAQERSIEAGTYRFLRIEFCKYNAGGASNAIWGTSEGVEIPFVGGSCVVSVELSPPITVNDGDAVTITLNYDLSGTVQTGQSATGQSCTGSGSTVSCFTVPTFVPSASK